MPRCHRLREEGEAMSAPKLKPCPFCGEQRDLHIVRAISTEVRCANCGAEGPNRWSKRAAISGWNNRHTGKEKPFAFQLTLPAPAPLEKAIKEAEWEEPAHTRFDPKSNNRILRAALAYKEKKEKP